VKPRPGNLPAELTSFVGRRRELGEVKRRLAATRLLTLTGAAGIGKTRLALRAAAETLRGFPDGAWLVDLAPLEDPALVTQAVFAALGLQDQSQSWPISTLTDHLAPRRLLVVLDNCEHLLDASAVFAGTVLRACPQVRILATSRQALGVAGEVRLPVPALSVPQPEEAGSPERVLCSDSVALFEERAASAFPGFRVDGSNSVAVTRLCQALDGMPLALELAAVRMATHSIAQLMEGLGDRLPALGRGDRSGASRHQTLGAAIDWSYNLLTAEERLLWARLSAFAAGFELDAARQVCGDAVLPVGDIQELVAGLIEKSIVVREPGRDPVRLRLLETMRQYGRDRLRQRDEETAIRSRHCGWVIQLAAAAARPDAGQAAAFGRVQRELGNVWAALDFLGKEPGQAERGLKLIYDLGVYWVVRGPLTDAQRVLASMLEADGGDSVARAEGLCVAGQLARARRDEQTARSLLEESLRMGRRVSSAEVIGWSLYYLAVIAWVLHEIPQAIELADRVLAHGDAMDDAQLRAATLTMLASLRVQQGDHAQALALGAEAVSASERLGEIYFRSFALWVIAVGRLRLGELNEAESFGRQAVALKDQLGAGEGLAMTLETLAWIAGARGDAERAARLLGAAESVFQAIPATLLPMWQPLREDCAARARGRLGGQGFLAAFDRGLVMSKDEAVADALERTPAPLTRAAHSRRGTSPLTRRELQVAKLVAEGVGNRQIAAQLFISERTVETHVTNMLNKLNLSSRMQLARWVADATGA
jgi:predicted ATPase/DNA-binding CsgD family transcriptional regulator